MSDYTELKDMAAFGGVCLIAGLLPSATLVIGGTLVGSALCGAAGKKAAELELSDKASKARDKAKATFNNFRSAIRSTS